jgi:hypothetical protein
MKWYYYVAIILFVLVILAIVIIDSGIPTTKTMKILDCEAQYTHYRIEPCSIFCAQPQPHPENDNQLELAKVRIGQCLCKKFNESNDPSYSQSIIELCNDYKYCIDRDTITRPTDIKTICTQGFKDLVFW